VKESDKWPIIGVDLERDYTDEDWKREGEHIASIEKHAENVRNMSRERDRVRLLKEHCPHCRFLYLPEEMDDHLLSCRERF